MESNGIIFGHDIVLFLWLDVNLSSKMYSLLFIHGTFELDPSNKEPNKLNFLSNVSRVRAFHFTFSRRFHFKIVSSFGVKSLATEINFFRQFFASICKMESQKRLISWVQCHEWDVSLNIPLIIHKTFACDCFIWECDVQSFWYEFRNFVNRFENNFWIFHFIWLGIVYTLWLICSVFAWSKWCTKRV